MGAHPRINDQAFRRRSIEFNLDREVHWGPTTHDVHVGVQRAEGRERLRRLSNGWGSIQVPGGVDLAEDGTPIFYVATVEQMSLRRQDGTAVAPIESHTESTSVEINDTVRWNAFEANVGVLLSEDVLYGQGLSAAPGTASGFALAPGHKYPDVHHPLAGHGAAPPRHHLDLQQRGYRVRQLRTLPTRRRTRWPGRRRGTAILARRCACCSTKPDGSFPASRMPGRPARSSRTG